MKCREIALDWDGKAFQDNKAEMMSRGSIYGRHRSYCPVGLWTTGLVFEQKVCELGAGAGCRADLQLGVQPGDDLDHRLFAALRGKH